MQVYKEEATCHCCFLLKATNALPAKFGITIFSTSELFKAHSIFFTWILSGSRNFLVKALIVRGLIVLRLISFDFERIALNRDPLP